MVITLTWAEVMLAHYVAGQRIAMNIKNSAACRFGADASRDSDGLHLTSCRAEIAVAKALNMFWSGAVGDYKAADVGGLIDVRAVNRKPGKRFRLILHNEDNDDRPYVLADTSDTPTVRLQGWILGRDGKHIEWWEDPTNKNRPAYFVPAEKLLPFTELGKWLESRSDMR